MTQVEIDELSENTKQFFVELQELLRKYNAFIKEGNQILYINVNNEIWENYGIISGNDDFWKLTAKPI